MKFQQRLIEELKASKYTQKEIANELGITESNLTNWKKGENVPSLETFYRLCILLEVSADYLLGIADN
ncbi:MAG: helix-turn-helix transcriptional regulator [Clostridia bacterium]|nr:helix-turn-helix transcriptional regulator [Clostridia bacterium]